MAGYVGKGNHRLWGVYKDADGSYFIATYIHAPAGAAKIDDFWAQDRHTALYRGDLIVEHLRKQEAKKEEKKDKDETTGE